MYDPGSQRRWLYCYSWHEGIAGRGPNEMSTCVFDFIQNKNVKNITFLSDTCSGQNHNKYMAMMYLYAVANTPNLETVIHKFLEPGHTQNEGDSMHSVIEKAKQGVSLFCLEQFYLIVRMAKMSGKEYKVKEMTTSDFYNFKELVNKYAKSWIQKGDGSTIIWRHVRFLKVIKGFPGKIWIKRSYNGEYEVLDLFRRVRGTRKEICGVEVPRIPNKPRVISILHDFKYLCEKMAIPKYYHGFDDSLKSGNVADSDSSDSD